MAQKKKKRPPQSKKKRKRMNFSQLVFTVLAVFIALIMLIQLISPAFY